MGIIVLILIVLAVVFFISRSNTTPSTTENQTRSSVQVSSDRNATTYRGVIKNDKITKKAFVMYVIGSVINLGEKWCEHIIYEGDDVKAKDAIEKAFDIVTTDKDKYYTRKGMFNPYVGQELASENKVFLDLYELLIFGSNSKETNRIDMFSQEEKTKLLMTIHTIHYLLISDDEEAVKARKELADGYDEAFGKQDTEEYSGNDAGILFEKYYNKMLPLINQSPYKHNTDRFELVYAMCVCSDYIAAATKKDRHKSMNSVQSVVTRLCPTIDNNMIDKRMSLYGEVIRGKALRGEWYYTVGDINNNANHAITKIVVLLGDALYNPTCLEDYFSEKREIIVRPITDNVAFLQNVINPLLASMREYADELASL